MIPLTVHGIGVVDGYAGPQKLCYLQSPDIALEDGRIFFSFTWPAEHPEIRATMYPSLAFASAMSPFGATLGLADLSLSIWDRVNRILGIPRLHAVGP